MKSIKTIGFERLRNNELFDILQRTHSLGVALLTQKDDATVLATYKKAIDCFDDALNQDTEFKDTKAVRSSDAWVCDLYRGLRHYLRGMMLCPDITKRRHAKQAMYIINKYGSITNKPYNHKHSVLHNTMQELHELPEETRESLSLSLWLDGLSQAIAQFISAREAQTAEKGAYRVGLVRETRFAAEKAHRTFINIINAFVHTYGEEYYTSFIDQVNTIISDAQTLSKARATRAGKTKDKAATTPQETLPEATINNTSASPSNISMEIPNMPTETNSDAVEECSKTEVSDG